MTTTQPTGASDAATDNYIGRRVSIARGVAKGARGVIVESAFFCGFTTYTVKFDSGESIADIPGTALCLIPEAALTSKAEGDESTDYDCPECKHRNYKPYRCLNCGFDPQATPPAQVAGSGMGEEFDPDYAAALEAVADQLVAITSTYGLDNASAQLRVLAKNIRAALAAQPAPGVGGDSVDALNYTVLFNAIAAATTRNPMNEWRQRASIDISVQAFKDSVAAALSRPAESVAQGGEVDLVTTSHRDGCSLSHCPNSLASCGCPTPATGSGGDIWQKISDDHWERSAIAEGTHPAPAGGGAGESA